MSPKKFKIRKNSPFLDFLRLQIHLQTELILPRHLPAAKLMKILKKEKWRNQKVLKDKRKKSIFNSPDDFSFLRPWIPYSPAPAACSPPVPASSLPPNSTKI
jgi:hypothetical protein